MPCDIRGRDRSPVASYKTRNAKGTIRNYKEARKDSPDRFQRDDALLTSSLWTSALQKCEAINLCCFKPSSLWGFVVQS